MRFSRDDLLLIRRLVADALDLIDDTDPQLEKQLRHLDSVTNEKAYTEMTDNTYNDPFAVQKITHSGESKIAHCKECERAVLKITKARR